MSAAVASAEAANRFTGFEGRGVAGCSCGGGDDSRGGGAALGGFATVNDVALGSDHCRDAWRGRGSARECGGETGGGGLGASGLAAKRRGGSGARGAITVSSIGARDADADGGRSRASATPTARCSATEAASTRPTTHQVYPTTQSSGGASAVSNGICMRGSPFISSSTRLTIISLPSAISMSSPSRRRASGRISASSSST